MSERFWYALIGWGVTGVLTGLTLILPNGAIQDFVGSLPMMTGIGAGILSFLAFAELIAALIARLGGGPERSEDGERAGAGPET
jgi:hypothetical protein